MKKILTLFILTRTIYDSFFSSPSTKLSLGVFIVFAGPHLHDLLGPLSSEEKQIQSFSVNLGFKFCLLKAKGDAGDNVMETSKAESCPLTCASAGVLFYFSFLLSFVLFSF